MAVQEYLFKINKLNAADEQEINQIIDQIITSLDISKESEFAEDLLMGLAKLVPLKNDHILSKFCSLVNFLSCKQKLIICSSSFEYLINFMSLKLSSCGTWVLSDVLIAFSTLLSNGDQLKFEKVNSLLSEDSILLSSLEYNDKEKSIQYNAFQCFFALLKNLGENALPSTVLNLVSQKCLLVLKNNKPCNIADPLSLKILISCLKCLQLVYSSKNTTVKNIGEVLGTLKSLLFYGLPGQSFMPGYDLSPTLACPDANHFQESQSESDAAHPKLRKQKKNKRRVKKSVHKSHHTAKETSENTNNAEPYLCDSFSASCLPSPSSCRSSFRDIKIKNSSSDSDFSDVDSQASKTKSLLASIRQTAYQTLQAVIKIVDQKTMFGYWSSFLPDHPLMSGMPSSQTIFTTILKDSASQVRLSALTLLIEMLRGSKQFLSLADGRSASHRAFTSLSSILASMISEIHRCLLLALLAENSTVLIIQILKCYALLSENVPYIKINKDILFKFLKHVKCFIHHKDIQDQVACLSVFASIVNSDQTPDQLQDLFLSPDFDYTVNVLISNPTSKSVPLLNDEPTPWIIEVCQNKIQSEDSLSIRIQSLQLLSNITGKYFLKTELFFPVIKDTVLFCLNNPDSTLQLHGAKVLDVIGRCMSNMPDVKDSLKPSVSDLFLKSLSGPLIKCLTNEEHKTLQAAVCDCLSTLPLSDFELLKSKQQLFYISVLLGLASDSNVSVRGAAVRCLGIYCLFPCLLQDASFYDDLSVILVKAVNDPNVNVRFKASWALGNLSDALFLNRDTFLSNKEVSLQFFHSTGKACVEFSKDCDRVKANAVRALGNFLFYIPENYLKIPVIEDFIKDACKALLSALSANFMKVCWNACYALRSMMKNKILLEQEVVNLEEVFNSLLTVLKSPNFKVRISAAQAISSLNSRTQYGAMFPILWKQILISLQTSHKDVNFKELKHQENLCNQLCYSLCQLVTLITTQDISDIEKDTLIAKETLLTSMWKFGTNSTEEKNVHVTIALEHITSLKENVETMDSDIILTLLQDVLNQAILAFYQQEI